MLCLVISKMVKDWIRCQYVNVNISQSLTHQFLYYLNTSALWQSAWYTIWLWSGMRFLFLFCLKVIKIFLYLNFTVYFFFFLEIRNLSRAWVLKMFPQTFSSVFIKSKREKHRQVLDAFPKFWNLLSNDQDIGMTKF